MSYKCAKCENLFEGNSQTSIWMKPDFECMPGRSFVETAQVDFNIFDGTRYYKADLCGSCLAGKLREAADQVEKK